MTVKIPTVAAVPTFILSNGAAAPLVPTNLVAVIIPLEFIFCDRTEPSKVVIPLKNLASPLTSNVFVNIVVPIPTFPTVESDPAFAIQPSVAIATIFCSPDASPTNFVALIIPVEESIVIPTPTVKIPLITAPPVKLVTPVTDALP